MATFVLVHGAFHGGWCYGEVAQLLRSNGHVVFAPTLTGVGDRSHLNALSINLDTHVRDIVQVIEVNDLNEVILCGHSYAGMVISGVAAQLGSRIKTLVYLDATLPDDGQSLFDLIGPERAAGAVASAGLTGTLVPPFDAAAFQGDPKNFALINEKCVPHPIACFIQKHRASGKEALVAHHTYVRSSRYKSINEPAFAKVKDLPNWRAIVLDGGHEMMIDQPDKLSAILLAEVDR